MSAECDLNCATCGLEHSCEDAVVLEETDEVCERTAVAIENSMCAKSLGSCKSFVLYKIKDGELLGEDIVYLRDDQLAENSAKALAEYGATTLICEAAEESIKAVYEKEGFRVITGARGSHSFAAKQYIAGKLK